MPSTILSPRTCRGGTAIALAILALSAAELRAEWNLNLYGGDTFDPNARLRQPGGVGLAPGDVPWQSEPSTSLIHDGARVTNWFGAAGWALALDFTHTKTAVSSGGVFEVSGMHVGVPVPDDEPAGNTFSSLRISHGLHLFTLDGLYRVSDSGGLESHAGLGAGVAIPHIETRVGDVGMQDTPVGDPAVQGLIGVSYIILGHFSFFAEYTLSYADISADFGGRVLDVRPWTNHFLEGLSFRLY